MIKYCNSITADEYNLLRKSVHWNEIETERLERGLKNSSFITVAKENDKVVGAARAIGDGGYITMIFDVIVSPKYQGNGIGKQLIKNIKEYIKEELKDGESEMVCLLVASGKEGFYKQFGFQERPSGNNGAGMSMWIKKGVNI